MRLQKDLGKNLSDEDISRAMKEMDDDDSGEVDFEEFFQWYQKAKASTEGGAASLALGAMFTKPKMNDEAERLMSSIIEWHVTQGREDEAEGGENPAAAQGRPATAQSRPGTAQSSGTAKSAKSPSKSPRPGTAKSETEPPEDGSESPDGPVVVTFTEEGPIGVEWKIDEEQGPMLLGGVAEGSKAAEHPQMVQDPFLMLTKLNDRTVKEMHAEGMDNNAIVALMKERPCTMTLEKQPSEDDEDEDDDDEVEGTTKAGDVIAQIKAEATYGHDSDTAKLLEDLFMTEWNGSRANESNDVRLLGLRGPIGTHMLRAWLSTWQEERDEDREVMEMMEGTPADIVPEEKPKWWRKGPLKRSKKKQGPQRLVPLPPKPPPITAEEFAFVRLKVRARKVLSDLHDGFLGQGGGDAAKKEKALPGSLLSFLCLLVGDDFMFPEGWLLPSEAKLVEFNPRGLTRNASKAKAILLVLNFLIAKTVLPAMVKKRPGSMRNLQADDRSNENMRLVVSTPPRPPSSIECLAIN